MVVVVVVVVGVVVVAVAVVVVVTVVSIVVVVVAMVVVVVVALVGVVAVVVVAIVVVAAVVVVDVSGYFCCVKDLGSSSFMPQPIPIVIASPTIMVMKMMDRIIHVLFILFWGAFHQLLSLILKLRILVLLPVSTLPYVVIVENYS
jgi:hypothetical protein